jgi:hypothetical protein
LRQIGEQEASDLILLYLRHLSFRKVKVGRERIVIGVAVVVIVEVVL